MRITGQGVRGDNRGQINRFGFRVFQLVAHRCRSLLLSFSTCYPGILGLFGLNLPPKDNLRKEDKSSAPKVSFIRRFHCTLFAKVRAYFKPVLQRFTDYRWIP